MAAGAVLVTGCRTDTAAVQQAPIVDGNPSGDPAAVNMADAGISGSMQPPGQPAVQSYGQRSDSPSPARNPAAYGGAGVPVGRARGGDTRVAGSAYNDGGQSSAETYDQAPYAGQSRAPRNEAYNYNQQAPAGAFDQNGNGSADNDDQLYSELLDPGTPPALQAPPPLPLYEQPEAPGPDYLWTPGYWNYAPAGYYYVPGNWVSAPFAGALWTPGWWGYQDRGYRWHHGYWGRHVGYYGGVNYGFGFVGIGYQGGYWNHDHFQYNRYCNHVEPRVVNNYVYQRNVTVVNNTYVNNSRVSYVGGPGGLQRRPVPAEAAATREAHLDPLGAQLAARREAEGNRQQFFAANHGRPQMLFASHPVLERNVAVPPQLARPQDFQPTVVSSQARPGLNGQAQPGLNGQARPGSPTPQQQRALAQPQSMPQNVPQNVQQIRNQQEAQRLQTLQQGRSNLRQQQSNVPQQQSNLQQQQSSLLLQQGRQQAVVQRQQVEGGRQLRVQGTQGAQGTLGTAPQTVQPPSQPPVRQPLDVQRQAAEQQRTQRLQLRQQAEAQRQQQQLNDQRRQFEQQRQQQGAQQQDAHTRQLRQQQLEAQQQLQVQHQQQAVQQQVQRQQLDQQREQMRRPAVQSAPAAQAPRVPQPAPTPQVAPAPRMEAPRAAPAPRMEAPRAAPASPAPTAAPNGGLRR